jgi:2-oxoglutarate dehydrogenase E2 component (dihydrolipoamide succinyltransferase)
MISAAEPATRPTGAPTPTPAPPAAAAVAQPGARQTRKKLTPLRQRIAERLVSAQHDAALLTTFNEVDMSAVMELRKKYQEDFVKRNGLKLGFMSFFVKAVVQALREVPSINTQIEGDMLVQNHFYDIGVAVSTEKGLMVPVIRNCDALGMAGIEKAITDAAGRAREGKITQTLRGACSRSRTGVPLVPSFQPPSSTLRRARSSGCMRSTIGRSRSVARLSSAP